MTTIRLQDLQQMCDRLNEAQGRPLDPYDGTTLKPNALVYLISQQYGGVALHQMAETGTAERDISGLGHGTKRELHTFLRGMLAQSNEYHGFLQ